MITEAIAAASKSSKSTSTPADFGSSRFGEPDRVCEVFVAITASSFRCAMLAAESSNYQNCVTPVDVEVLTARSRHSQASI
jgi:hypothetical protein